MAERILVAIDLQDGFCTKYVLNTAIETAIRHGSSMVVLNVITDPNPCLPGLQQEHMRQEDLDALVNNRVPGSIPTKVCAAIDRPAWHYIAKLSRDEATDLVVIGAVESANGKREPGSNARELLNRLERPVLAVWPGPASSRAPDAGEVEAV